MFDPYFEEKVWGKVQHVFASEDAALSCLEVKKGFRCSKHHHEDRYNMFAVQSGCIVVEKWGVFEGNSYNTIILRPGDSCTVPPDVLHRFSVLTSGKLIELYWPRPQAAVRRDDIVREDVGGPFDEDKLRTLLYGRGQL